MAFVLRFFVVIVFVGICLYAYVDRYNLLTQKRLQLPMRNRELQLLTEENVRLQFAIDTFENPLHLMELARKPEFSHLKHPCRDQIIIVEEKDGK